MYFRTAISVASLIVLALLLVACVDGHPTPAQISIAPPTAAAATVSVSAPPPTSMPFPTPNPTPALELLTREIPPCTRAPGPSVDPCDPDAPLFEMNGAHYEPELGDEPRAIRLDDGQPPAWVGHLALRGTYLPGTTRCTAGDPFRPPSYLQNEFGDITTERSFKCYIDVGANAYILGTGPSTLTVMLLRHTYWDGWYAPDGENGQTEQDVIEELRHQFETGINGFFPGREHIVFLGPAVDLSSEIWRVMEYWDVQRQDDGTVIAVHPDRDLWQRLRPDEYQTHLSRLEMELPAFTQAVTTAHQARVAEYGGRIGADENLPMLVSNANQLRQYYTEVGAYATGVPTPVQPPPPCGLAVPDQANNPGLMRDCINLLAAQDTLRGTAALNWSVDTAISGWNGVTVAGSPGRVTGLLLTSKSLTGTIPPDLARLDGLQFLWLNDNRLTGGIPSELGDIDGLIGLALSKNQLAGEIPPELGGLSNLDYLWLHDNALTGEIPAELGGLAVLRALLLSTNQLSGEIPSELGDLPGLEDIWLSVNQLTGCIPAALRDLENSDLFALGLQYCETQ